MPASADQTAVEPPPAGFDAQGAPIVAAPAAPSVNGVASSPNEPMRPSPEAATPVSAVAPAASAVAMPLEASGSELDLFRLDAVLNAAVVTASGGEEEERSTALANVFSISREEILVRGYHSVAEILTDVPGLYVIDDLVTPSLAVRGVNGGLAAGTRIVKVMINGQVVGFRPELTAFLGPEFIPLDAIERIEVAKGPLSALYGANAFLATVNIITRRSSDGLTGEVSGRLSFINGNPGGGGSVRLGYRGDKAWLIGAVSGDRLNRSGVLLPNSFPGQVHEQELTAKIYERPTQADLAAPVSMFFSAGVGSEALGNLVAQLGLQHLDAISNFRLNSLLTDRSRVVINNFYSSLHYDKDWQRGGLALDAAYAHGSPDGDYKLELTANPAYAFRPNYDYHSGRLHAEGSYDPLAERLQLRAGVDFEYARETSLYYTQLFQTREGLRSPGDSIDLIGDAQPRQQDYYGVGAYLRLSSRPSRRLPGLRLSVDFRIDKIWFGPVEFEPQVSARGGLAYKFSPRLAVKLFGGRAFQTPAGTLLFGYPGFGNENNVIGNVNVNLASGAALKPQTVNSVEAGLSATPSKHLSIEASFYVQRLQNKIEFLQVGPDFFAANRGEQDSLGFEALARSSYGRFTGYLWGAFNYSISGEQQNPPPLYPNLTGALGLDMDIPEAYVHLHGRIRVVGPRGPSQSNVYLNDGLSYELPTFATADLVLTSKGLHLFGPRAETYFTAMVRNVTATRFTEPSFGGFDQPNIGQSFWLECKQSF